ncbi:hypothetical protein [Bordetella phage vB_BbrM_PHB04]|uniref:Uncharacterized protein n=1 Tax=Bordetella phage vB_BbrM_PHB04 TaxID=2029657 RepID=A0A291L9Z6_9CAUD|nr:hypothetical protein HOS14_gp091 [Bordetella phage vB_BbrM_PHB04]ATI15709.1 hypothetical protein [Bordetella phage vB_BbrM_PHB04]
MLSLAGLTFCAPVPAAPAPAGTPPICSFIAGMSQAIAEDRDDGLSKIEVIREILSADASDKAKALALNLADLVYQPEIIDEPPKKIAAALLLACVQKVAPKGAL